jgi:hypothetical protein
VGNEERLKVGEMLELGRSGACRGSIAVGDSRVLVHFTSDRADSVPKIHRLRALSSDRDERLGQGCQG